MGSAQHLSLEEAYQAAYLWLDHAGEPPIDVTEPAHGAVELISENWFARVRSSDGPVEQSSVLALLRAARPGKKLIIFSPSGFSPGAVSIAETQGIALFSVDVAGDVRPETTQARTLVPPDPFNPPFASRVEEEQPSWPPAPRPAPMPEAPPQPTIDRPEQDTDTTSTVSEELDEWRECAVCGTPYHTHAKFCRECGADLRSASPTAADGHTHSDEAPSFRCRTCGSFDIEELR